MNTIHSAALAITLYSLTAAPRAQNLDGPYWSEYPIPAAGVTQFRSIGTTAILQSPNACHLYSGFTQKWTVLPVSASASFQIANAYCIVQDGSTFHGFASRTGQVSSLAASSGATLQIGSSSASWIAYVQDGNTIYGWSSFHGQWVGLSLSAPPTSVQLGAHTLLVVAGTTAYAMSPYFGTWVAEPIRGGGTFQMFNAGAIGTWGGPDEVKGFSAYHNSWATASFAGAPTAAFTGQEGYALLQTTGNADTLAFSALRGTFQQLATLPTTTWFTGPDVAIALDAAGAYGYAPAVDAMVALPTVPPTSTVQVASGRFGCYAMIDTGASVVAFHGLTGAVSTAPTYVAGASIALGDSAAFLQTPGGGGLAYSALRNDWSTAPTTAPLAVTAQFEGLVLADGTDFLGYSARKGTWSSVPANGQLVAQTAGSLAFVVGSDGVDAFDPVVGRWNHVATGSGPLTSVFRLTGLAHDGATAYGYSLFSNAWDSIPLQGTVQQINASSSIGFVRTNSHYYLFTANGSLSNLGRFPEFSRFVVRGANYVSIQAGAPGSLVFQGVGPETEQATPFGTLRVDLGLASVSALGVVPASGVLRTVVPIPDLPMFNGFTIAVQDALVDGSGNIRLTNAQLPYVW